MIEIVVATGNLGKVRELEMLLDGVPAVLRPLSFPFKVEEAGSSYEENALIKARAASRITDLPVIAEDSGLEVRGLGWAPGVRSSRFMGSGSTDREKCMGIIRLLEGKPPQEREARFISCICFLWKERGIEKVFRGEVQGIIANSMRGSGGFGYDPIFFVPEMGKTFSEMNEREKNEVSHRGRAAKKLKEFLLSIL